MKMHIMAKHLISLLILALLWGCGGDQPATTDDSTFDTHGQAGIQDDDSQKNILQIALGSADHSTLVARPLWISYETSQTNPNT